MTEKLSSGSSNRKKVREFGGDFKDIESIASAQMEGSWQRGLRSDSLIRLWIRPMEKRSDTSRTQRERKLALLFS